MQKLALILFLLPSFIFLRAGNESTDFTQIRLGTTKKELTKEMRQTDKTFNLNPNKMSLDDVKKPDGLIFPSKKVTAYAIGDNQLVFDNDRLAILGLVGSRYANDTLRFAALDSLKADVITRLGEPLKLTANSIVWLTDSELYAISTRNQRIYITNIQRQWVSAEDVSAIETYQFKYYDANQFDLTLQDISGFKNGMSKNAFTDVFKKKMKNPDSFQLEDYLDLDNKQAANGLVKYSVDDTKALFMNDAMMLVSGFARPSLTTSEKDMLIQNIVSVQGPPRVISNRHTWKNEDEGLDLIFEEDIDGRHNLIFIIGSAVFFKN